MANSINYVLYYIVLRDLDDEARLNDTPERVDGFYNTIVL